MLEKKTSILALLPYPVFPAKMGGQKAIALLYRNLHQRVPVTLVGTANNNLADEKELNLLPLLSNSIFRYVDVRLFFKLKKIIQQQQITHLILEHPYFGWLGILLQKTTDVKLVVRSHNIESMRFKSTGKWWWGILWSYEKALHRHADINFFITENDRQYALNKYKIRASSAHVLTYGFPFAQPPSAKEKTEAKQWIQHEYGWEANPKIILFNGTLNYLPNSLALKEIIEKINPLLAQETHFNYKIIICGKNLPAHFKDLALGNFKNIGYAGYVPDINIYLKAADIFINPVVDGGGIKTKLVEALGYNLSCVSYQSGATGLPMEICDNKLFLVKNNDSEAFARAIINICTHNNINTTFYDYFSWAKIADKAAELLKYKTK